jgi:hypothetical protein
MGDFVASQTAIHGKPVVNAALQNGKVMSRIKTALTYWFSITF